MYIVRLEKKVRKFLDSISDKDAEEILSKLKILSENPYQNSLDIKKIKSQKELIYRMRVKEFRLLYKISIKSYIF